MLFRMPKTLPNVTKTETRSECFEPPLAEVKAELEYLEQVEAALFK